MTPPPLTLWNLLSQGQENTWTDLLADLVCMDPRPLLSVLGHTDRSLPEVVRERAIGVKGRRGRADLVLTHEGETFAIVEVKVKSSLDPEQLGKYEKDAGTGGASRYVLTPRALEPSADELAAAGATEKWELVSWEQILSAYTSSDVPVVQEWARAWWAVSERIFLRTDEGPDSTPDWWQQHWVTWCSGQDEYPVRRQSRMLLALRKIEARLAEDVPGVSVEQRRASRGARPVLEVGMEHDGFRYVVQMMEYQSTLAKPLQGVSLQVGWYAVSPDASEEPPNLPVGMEDHRIVRFVRHLDKVLGATADGGLDVQLAGGKGGEVGTVAPKDHVLTHALKAELKLSATPDGRRRTDGPVVRYRLRDATFEQVYAVMRAVAQGIHSWHT